MAKIDFDLLFSLFGNDCRNCAYFTPCDMFFSTCNILCQCFMALEIGFY